MGGDLKELRTVLVAEDAGAAGGLSIPASIPGFELSGRFIGEGYLGGGKTGYEVMLKHDGGTVAVLLEADRYELGDLGLEGISAGGRLRAQGELSTDRLIRLGNGELGAVADWDIGGEVQVWGEGWSLRPQRLELGVGADALWGHVAGEGYDVLMGYDYERSAVEAEVALRGFSPLAEVEVTAGVLKELAGLLYEGDLRGSYGEGVLGYEGAIKVWGSQGQTVGGIDVGGLELELAGAGDEAGLKAVKAAGFYKELRLGYEGSLVYQGLGVAGGLRLSRGGETVQGKVEGSGGKYGLEVEDGELAGFGYRGVEVGYQELGDRHDVVVRGSFGEGSLEGSGSLLKGGKGYEGALGLTGIDAIEVVKLLGWAGLSLPELGVDEARVWGDFGVRGDYEEVAWVAGGIEAEVRGSFGEVKVRGSGVGDGKRYEVKGLGIGYKGEELGIEGKGEYGERGFGFEGELRYGGLGYEVGLRYADGEAAVWGGYGLEGVLLRTAGGYEGKLKAEGLPVALGEGLVYGDIEAAGRYEGGELWVEAKRLGVRYEGEGEYPTLKAEGLKYGKGELSVERLWVNGEGYGLAGSLAGSLGKTIPPGSQMPDIMLTGNFSGIANPNESYLLEALYSAGIIDAQIAFKDFSLTRFIPEDFAGVLQGRLSVQGALDIAALTGADVSWNALPRLALEASLVKGEFRNQALTLDLKAELTEGSLNLDLPVVEYAGHRIEKLVAQILIEEGKAQIVGDYRKGLGAEKLEATIVTNADFRFSGEKGVEESRSFSTEFTGTLANIKFHETLVRSWTFSGSYGKDGFELQGGGEDLRATLARDGYFELLLADDLPVIGSATGRMNGNILSAKVDNIHIDLARLASFLPIENLKILDGDLSGSLSLSGPLVDPEINGTLAAQGVVIESTSLLKDRIGPFSSAVNFTGRNIELVPTVIPLSTGALEVSASGLLDNWELSDLGFNVVTRNDSVVILSTKIAGITLIDTRAQLDIALSLDAGTLVATGSVYLDRGQVMIDPQGFGPEAQQPVDPDAPTFRIDATLNFGKQLEVYLPDSNLPIIRGFTLPGSLLYLKFDSSSGEFTLDGAIDLRSGYVFYYLRNFFIRSATIEFAENSAKFNPLVTVNAELRESGRDGLVRINLSTEKAPLSNLNPRLSSIPFYSETELIAIMSGGVLAVDTSESLTIREAAIASSEFIPQLNIFKSFEQRVQKALGMDIVFIRSSFMQRWLLDLTKPASEPNPEDPLARYLDQSELYMGRYITDSAFFHASLRFREDPLVSSSRLRLDSEFGIEFDSPFGQINWSITPFMGEGSLVSGQELSLSWRLVY